MDLNTSFSKLSREEKIQWLSVSGESQKLLTDALNQNPAISGIVDQLSENTITHYTLPLGVAPNVLINGKSYHLPLVTEESSVVAAIAKAAKFWFAFGGFQTQVLGTEKKGQVHFFWKGNKELLHQKFEPLKDFILLRVNSLTKEMRKRGGGITSIQLLDKTHLLTNYFQLDVSFETADAMGANFINSCLEEMSKALKQFFSCDLELDAELLEVNMAILSNYTSGCRVLAKVMCAVDAINAYGESLETPLLAEKLVQAVQIAQVSTERAVTHNKGIFNGIDALALATGNDWRAIEACGHAYASRSGTYASLTKASIVEQTFILELEIPLSVGTVGGITNLHPLAKIALEILQKPTAPELMQLMAVSGLAANFSALLALTTSGIQKGHMKMHLSNILLQLNATEEQSKLALTFFKDKTVSFTEVKKFLSSNS
ncbi:MAG TPA: hydroxymethylglutaryl-CoA reductase, degradative [Marinilabiliales bacterium]|nr:MAG: hydroxymethylglutaryl-CoA reductase, degradative [Bacteroidetes bacterium GWA2_40_14]OFX61784.1 MAG: hydroxymethylglutaryl-CoA reductase, degradative [Bacteroidetes bacterium GWC2_40_13]OFX75999.1 MAG: hydroxymethylglutaryl-CoA reductase, degradative [Bacteroidetes bacterium GWD2_40_43]OFX94388.1 MAG: hydroxymethylglutaryl-CoA reductase, degradative [Bacteroidetes bacterium GWE2_40_63]OFY18866.1 MAG: hydroxymethylglutaryl-CoA reductase, degradative [Bacteroidetes bacterium GWF2_40_13]O